MFVSCFFHPLVFCAFYHIANLLQKIMFHRVPLHDYLAILLLLLNHYALHCEHPYVICVSSLIKLDS